MTFGGVQRVVVTARRKSWPCCFSSARTQTPGGEDRLTVFGRGLQNWFDAREEGDCGYSALLRSGCGNDHHGIALVQVAQARGRHAAESLLKVRRPLRGIRSAVRVRCGSAVRCG